MGKSRFLLLPVLFLMLLADNVSGMDVAVKSLVYKKVLKNATSIINVTLEKKEDYLVVDYEFPDKNWRMKLKDGETVYWSGLQPDFTFECISTNALLSITQNGKVRKVKMSKRPWIESFEVGFTGFILNENKKSMVFQVLRPDDLALFEMEITKQNEETVVIEGQKYEVVKTKVNLTGLLAKFWSATYWYRKSDGILVKYEGPEGNNLVTTYLIGNK